MVILIKTFEMQKGEMIVFQKGDFEKRQFLKDGVIIARQLYTSQVK